jgi:hypothetical protein
LRMRLDALIMRKLGYGPLGPCHVAVFGTLLASFTGFLCRRKTCACRHCATRGWLPTVPSSTYIHDIGNGCVSGMLAAVADEMHVAVSDCATAEMYGHLPSTNNTAEASNSMESRFCRHNVELVPSIHDSFRITLRQQKLHEGILSGATSPTHFNRNRTFFLLTLSQAK